MDISWHEAKRREKEIMHDSLHHRNGPQRLYGFHSWEGKHVKDAQKYNDVLLDNTSYSPILVSKLVDRGISVIYLGRESKFSAVMRYVLNNSGVVLVTKNRDLDGQLPHDKSLFLDKYRNIEDVSRTVILFAKELPQPRLSEPAKPEADTKPPPPKSQVVAPTWHGDVPYSIADIKSSGIVIGKHGEGHGPRMVDEDTVDYDSIRVPSIVKLANGKVELTKEEMEGAWLAKTVTASESNAMKFIKEPKGIVISIGAGPTDPVARAIAGQEGLHMVSLDKSLNYMRFLRDRIGKEAHGHDYIVADSRYLPFKEGSVDLSTSTYLFDHLEQKALVLSMLECRRVSKGGVYLELAQSQGTKRFESIKFLMELCGYNNMKSLNYGVHYNNGNSARSYIFTADATGKPYKERLARAACGDINVDFVQTDWYHRGRKREEGEELRLMERMLVADYQRYRNMNRYFETLAENLYALLEQMGQKEDATHRFARNLILSVKDNSSFCVRFNPAARGAPEKIDTEALKQILNENHIKHTITQTRKGALDVRITSVPESTIWIMGLIRTDPTKLTEATRKTALDSIYEGVDTDEKMNLLDTRGYWGYDTGPKVHEESFVVGIRKVEEETLGI